jgi:hypothetical protein
VWIMHGGAGGGHQGARGGKAGRGGGPGKDAAVRSTGEGLGLPPPPAEPDRIDGSNQMMPGMLRMLLLMSLVMMTLCQMCAAGGDGAGPAAARARCGGAAGSLASDG